MKPKMHSVFKNESSSSRGILEGISDPKITSLEDENSADVTNNNSNSDEIETAECHSCASSFSDDSGFSSNIDASEYISDFVLRTGCDVDSKGEEMKTSVFNCFDDACEKVNEKNCDCDTEGEILKSSNCDCNEEYERVKICSHDGECEKVQKWNEDVNNMNYEFEDENGNINRQNCEFVNENGNINRQNCEFDDRKVNRENTGNSNNTNNSQIVKLENYNKMTVCSENVSLDTSADRTRDILEMNAAVVLHRRHRSVSLSDTCKKHYLFINQAHSRRQRLNSSTSTVASVTTSNPRAGRRRCRIQDVNNNDSGTRHLSSYLGKAPCKLQDYFHDKGLLSLVACIIYTLILVVIISALSIIMEALKSFIGIQNLKKIRRNIVLSRRTRMSMAAG